MRNNVVSIYKEWNKNPQAWCSCCGKQLPVGTEIVRITTDGTSRILSKAHFMAWLENNNEKFIPFCYLEEVEKKQ
jgi:hypothetical protein